ncbi:VQ motif-containing protein 29-like [Rhododendron vialii]|uniref:VQ motif-containing protein 29-like n=1 Tax=Rhododendron vialii TaxID=182163 RepID=UPI00265ED644|nr:VQ motif-containing protein 29-like [Rhododendron vialii]
MESQSHSSSSSSSTFANTNPKQPHFHAPLRAVRKVPAKPWKKPVAPLPPPTPPGIYNVEPKDFKDLVQKLTKGPDFQSRRLERVAPPPLSLPTTAAVSDGEKPATAQDLLPSPYTNTAPLGAAVLSPLGFSSSPTSRAWSTFLLTSPGTTPSWEQSTMF